MIRDKIKRFMYRINLMRRIDDQMQMILDLEAEAQDLSNRLQKSSELLMRYQEALARARGHKFEGEEPLDYTLPYRSVR